MTLADRRFDLDEDFESATPVAAAIAAPALEALAQDAATAPIDTIERGLRDALAPITASAGKAPGWAGWATHGPAPSAEAVRDRYQPDPPPTVARLLDTLDEAADQPAFHRGAERLLVLLDRAAPLAGELPAWLPESTRLTLAADLESAAAGVTEPASRTKALGELERLALAAELIDTISTVANQREARGLRDSIVSLFGRTRGQPAQLRASARVLLPALRDADIEGLDNARRQAVQPLRPFYDSLRVELLLATERLLTRLAGSADAQNPTSDPAIISLRLEQRRARSAIERIIALSDFIADAERTLRTKRAMIDERYEAFGDELMRLARGAGDPAAAERAIARINALAQSIEQLAPAPGEAELIRLTEPQPAGAPGAAAAQRLTALTGGRAPELLATIKAAREAWLTSWPDPLAGETAGRLERLRTLAGVAELAADLAWALPLDEPANRAAAHPAWQLNAGARAPAEQAAQTELSRLVADAIADRAGIGERAAELADRTATLRIAGRLNRALAAIEDPSAETSEPAAAHELALGAPDPIRAVAFAARAEMADVCRYAAELARARAIDDPALAEDLEAFISRRASETLDLIDGSIPNR